MVQLSDIAKWEVLLFLLALAAAVVVQLLTGDINTRRLLCGRISGRRRKEDHYYFSPERVQLLIFTLGAALHYVALVFTNSQPGKFPDVPEAWPAVIGGSNLVYLGGKAYSRWLSRTNSLKPGR
jgi:hypothetical protein